MVRRRRQVAFARSGDLVEVRLGEEERDLVGRLAEQLRTLLAADDDPGLRRLYPAAYPDDPDRDADYMALVHDDLLRHRLDAVEVVGDTCGNDTLDPAELEQWMVVLNSLRLVLGTRLDISEEDEFDPEAPDVAERSLLLWLGLLLEEALLHLSMLRFHSHRVGGAKNGRPALPRKPGRPLGVLWCSLECTPACQAGGRGFKSRQDRHRPPPPGGRCTVG